LSEKAISSFLHPATTSPLKKALKRFSVKQLFSIYGRKGRGERNISHTGKYSRFYSFAAKRQKQQPRVISQGPSTDQLFPQANHQCPCEEQLPPDGRHAGPPHCSSSLPALGYQSSTTMILSTPGILPIQ